MTTPYHKNNRQSTRPGANQQQRTPQRKQIPFSAGVFLIELKNTLEAQYLCQKFLVINKFLYHIRTLRTDDDNKDFPALNRHIREKGVPYGRTEDLFTAFKTILKFQALKSIAKKEDRRLTDEEIIAEGLDEETYLRAMREIALYLAWKENLSVPEEILKATEEFAEDIDDGPSIDEIASVTLGSMADNHSQRSPIVFIVDTSMAMRQYLDTVSDGFNELFELINKTRELRRGAEVCVITTGGGAKVLVDFADVESAHRKIFGQKLEPYGPSHMGDALTLAMDCLDKYRDKLRAARQGSTVPWIIVFTGGRWLRNDKVNTHLDEQLDTLARKCDPDVHDFEVHTIIPSPEIANDEVLMENINRIPGWKYKPDDLNRIFSDIFRSIRISRSEAPANDVPLKISGTL